MGMLIKLYLEEDRNKLNILVLTSEQTRKSLENGSNVVANFILPLTYGKTSENESGIGVQLESETGNGSPEAGSEFHGCIEDFFRDVETENKGNEQEKSAQRVEPTCTQEVPVRDSSTPNKKKSQDRPVKEVEEQLIRHEPISAQSSQVETQITVEDNESVGNVQDKAAESILVNETSDVPTHDLISSENSSARIEPECPISDDQSSDQPVDTELCDSAETNASKDSISSTTCVNTSDTVSPKAQTESANQRKNAVTSVNSDTVCEHNPNISKESEIQSVSFGNSANDRLVMDAENTNDSLADFVETEVQNAIGDFMRDCSDELNLDFENSTSDNNLQNQNSTKKPEDEIRERTKLNVDSDSTIVDDDCMEIDNHEPAHPQSVPLVTTKSSENTPCPSDRVDASAHESPNTDLLPVIATSTVSGLDQLSSVETFDCTIPKSKSNNGALETIPLAIDNKSTLGGFPAEVKPVVDPQGFDELKVPVDLHKQCEGPILVIKAEPNDDNDDAEQLATSILDNSALPVSMVEVYSEEVAKDKFAKYNAIEESILADSPISPIQSPVFFECDNTVSFTDLDLPKVKAKKRISFADPLTVDLEKAAGLATAVKRDIEDENYSDVEDGADISGNQDCDAVGRAGPSSIAENDDEGWLELLSQILENLYKKRRICVSPEEFMNARNQIRNQENEIEEKISNLVSTNGEMMGLLNTLDVNLNKAKDVIQLAIVQKEEISDLVQKTINDELTLKERALRPREVTTLRRPKRQLEEAESPEELDFAPATPTKRGKRRKRKRKKSDEVPGTAVKRTRSQTNIEFSCQTPRILLERFESEKDDQESDHHVDDADIPAEPASAELEDESSSRLQGPKTRSQTADENLQPPEIVTDVAVQPTSKAPKAKRKLPAARNEYCRRKRRPVQGTADEKILLRAKRKMMRTLPKVKLDDKCFACHEDGVLMYCESNACPRAFHSRCLNMSKLPPGRWLCPWHYCTLCNSRIRVKKCAECLNSYCVVHLKGNIFVENGERYVCRTHKTQSAVSRDGDSTIDDDDWDSERSPTVPADFAQASGSNSMFSPANSANSTDLIDLSDEENEDEYETADPRKKSSSVDNGSKYEAGSSAGVRSALRNNFSIVLPDIINLIDENDDQPNVTVTERKYNVIDAADETSLAEPSNECRETVYCALCDAIFFSKEALVTHVREHEKDGDLVSGKLFWCCLCKQPFADELALSEHNRTHVTQSVLSCSKCDFKTAQKSSLVNHEKTHDTTRYVCSICDKTFRMVGKARQHSYTVHGIRATDSSFHVKHDEFLSCVVCKFECESQALLNRHLQTHISNGVDFICFLCDQKFDARALFNFHMRSVHYQPNGVKIFPCGVCGLSFDSLRSLKSHLITHGN